VPLAAINVSVIRAPHERLSLPAISLDGGIGRVGLVSELRRALLRAGRARRPDFGLRTAPDPAHLGRSVGTCSRRDRRRACWARCAPEAEGMSNKVFAYLLMPMKPLAGQREGAFSHICIATNGPRRVPRGTSRSRRLSTGVVPAELRRCPLALPFRSARVYPRRGQRRAAAERLRSIRWITCRSAARSGLAAHPRKNRVVRAAQAPPAASSSSSL
jgi:hypothetical protein